MARRRVAVQGGGVAERPSWKRVALLAGLSAAVLFGGFAFVTTTLIDVRVGTGGWAFYLLLAFALFVASLVTILRWRTTPALKAFALVLAVALALATTALGIAYRPFDARNLHLKLGLDWTNESDIPPVQHDDEPAPSKADFTGQMPPAIDQGTCNTCWAVAPAAALTARANLASKNELAGTPAVYVCSPDDVDSNLWRASPQFSIDASGYSDCANGNSLTSGFVQGVPTLNLGCLPYYAPGCPIPGYGSPGLLAGCSLPSSVPSDTGCFATPPLVHTTCTTLHGSTKQRLRVTGLQTVKGEEAMMKEIKRNGPIVCGISFMRKDSKSSAWTLVDPDTGYGYSISAAHISRPSEDGAQYQTNFAQGGHALVIYGFGELNGVKYWLVQNSWGSQWGLNGRSKIERGVNAWGIEGQVEGYPCISPSIEMVSD